MSIEPVAYINVEERKLEWAKPTEWHTPTVVNLEPVPLYTKQEWVGLTGLEVEEAYCSVSDKEWAIGGLTDARVFFCAIEAKLKDKNT